jgi:hypothetical protein
MITEETQLLDAIEDAMARQGWRRAVVNGGLCAYRTDDGRGCAIGCLIPAERYSERFEGAGMQLVRGESAAATNLRLEIFAAAGIHPSLMHIAATVQRVHDKAFTDAEWKANFATYRRLIQF